MSNYKFVTQVGTLVSLMVPLLAEHINHVFEGRADAFFHTSDRFRDIYGVASGSYGIEAMYRWCHWGFWGNFEYTSKCGNSIGFCNPTKVKISNASFGVKWLYDTHCLCRDITPYIGLGAAFAHVKVRNNSLCGLNCCDSKAIGAAVKSGIYIPFWKCGVADFFVDYINQETHFANRSHIDGVKIGLGLGWTF